MRLVLILSVCPAPDTGFKEGKVGTSLLSPGVASARGTVLLLMPPSRFTPGRCGLLVFCQRCVCGLGWVPCGFSRSGGRGCAWTRASQHFSWKGTDDPDASVSQVGPCPVRACQPGKQASNRGACLSPCPSGRWAHRVGVRSVKLTLTWRRLEALEGTGLLLWVATRGQ